MLIVLSVYFLLVWLIFSKLKRTAGNSHGLSFGAQNGGIAIDPAKYGLDAMPPDSAPSVPYRREEVLDDLGECFVDTGSGYSPYVHEAKAEPWSRAKATGRWVKDVCAGADFVGKGETVRQGGQRVWWWLKGVKPKWYGAILGVSKADINARYASIVEFAGLHRFMQTPVKRYSDGMKVRLGFAVAVNVESDILLIDEVLAVGDEEFKAKCLQRMVEFTNGETTVIVTTHQRGMMQSVCERAVYVEEGSVVLDGPVGEVWDYYEQHVAAKN